MTELEQFEAMLVRAKVEYEKCIDTGRVDGKPFETTFYLPNAVVAVFLNTGGLVRFENLD